MEQHEKESIETYPTAHLFNEPEWIRLLFLLNDSANWIEQQSRSLLYTVPVNEKKKFRTKGYYLKLSAMAHIIDKHYYKVDSQPQASKFTVDVPMIIKLIKDAKSIIPVSSGKKDDTNLYRTSIAENIVGYDKSKSYTKAFTVITDLSGTIVSAFPGYYDEKEV